MFTKLHNRIQTHIDPHEGEIITTDGKLPVSAKLTNFKLKGKSEQAGTPTPETPVPINSVAHNTNIISCGKNLIPFKQSATTNGVTITASAADNSYTLNGTSSSTVFFDLLGTQNSFSRNIPSGNFYLSGCPVGGSATTYRLQATVRNAVTGSGAAFYFDSGSGTTLTIPNGYEIWLRIQVNVGITLNNIVFLPQLEYGSQFSGFKKYISSTTQLNLIGAPNAPAEWVGKPINLMSLPDGTADEYKADDGVVIKKVTGLTVSSSVDYRYASFTTTLALLSLPVTEINSAIGNDTNILCNIALGGIADAGYAYVYRSSTNNYFGIIVPKLELTSLDNAGAQAWILAQINAHGNIVFQYSLVTPVIIPVTAQPTPKSVYAQPNNIFTDSAVQPTVSCGVRKLGNRPFVDSPIIDENGDYLVDENGNNIIGVI